MWQRQAGINTHKTLESYHFAFNLGVNQAQIMIGAPANTRKRRSLCY
jgi:hypothetical protein